jgi:ribosome-binding protein aMBF1 (putative translation factor)
VRALSRCAGGESVPGTVLPTSERTAARVLACELMSRRSDRTAGVEAEEVARPFLPWLGRACRQAREDRGVVQVKIAAAIEVNQATIARFEDGSAWPRRPEEVLMAYASELDMDVRLLWVHAFVLWLEHEPVLDKDSQERIRAALERLQI